MVTTTINPETGAVNVPPAQAKNRKQQAQKAAARQHKLTQAMVRLGVSPLPQHYTEYLPVAQLVIDGSITKEEERGAKQLAANLKALGTILHPPAVEEQGETYRVLAGRRRVLAARLTEMAQIECRIYPPLTPEQRRSLSLSENFTRSPNRRVELEGVCRLVRGNTAVTDQELCAIFGLSPGTAKKYLRIAQLPEPLVDEAVEGNLPMGLAEQIVRLSKKQQAELAELVEEGESISEAQVHQMRYARASRNLRQLEASFETASELTEQLLSGNGHEAASSLTTPSLTLATAPKPSPLTELSLPPETESSGAEGSAENYRYYRMILAQLKQYVAAQRPGRSAHQIGLYIEAILAELGGIA